MERPLDEGSFVYFVRTLPLRVGLDTSFNDYFKADRNPVRLRVLRRDTIEVPAGKFAALVVQPIFKTKGIFSEGGEAQVWLSDDENRIILPHERTHAGPKEGRLRLLGRRHDATVPTSGGLV